MVLDELMVMRSTDGDEDDSSDEGDVQDALYEAVGCAPLCVRSGCTVHQMAPNQRNAT